MAQQLLPSARRHYARSALLAQQAVTAARQARPRGRVAVAGVVMARQVAAATQAQIGVTQMLLEQRIDESADALLNSLAFTTSADAFLAMLDVATGPTATLPTDMAFDRLIASLVQDAGRAAEQVATSTRPNVGWVRQLTPPSCSRCVVLAGRVYRYSSGFRRHPGDDCVTVPVREGDTTYAADPQELARTGQVRGLSKADQQAIDLGADLSQIVNVRLKAAGLSEASEVLARAGRPTPAGIFRSTNTREEALTALAAAGYLR